MYKLCCVNVKEHDRKGVDDAAHGCCRTESVAGALMMQAHLLRQQQASVSAALAFPSYLALSPLFSRILPSSSLLNEFPQSTLLENFCTPSSTLSTAFPAESKCNRSVVFVISFF